jgi:hypothetical protein
MSRYVLALLTTLLVANAGFAAEVSPAPTQSGSPTPLPLVTLGRPWTLMGNGGPLALPGRCDTGMDSQKFADIPPLHSVRCTSAVLPSWGGAYKTDIDFAALRGKRVRISASLRGEGIEKVATAQYSHIDGEGGLWIALGTPRDGLMTNRMQERAIRGTTGWEARDFVVDVPADANQLMAGYWMQGKGQMWVRDLKVEEVPLTVAVNWDRKAPNSSGAPDMSLAVTTVPRPTDAFLPPPVKWFLTGEQGFELCDAGVDATMLASGQPNLTIACKVPVIVFLRQAPVAPPYWGKRVRFSAWIKTENVVARSDVLPVGGSFNSAQGAALYISASDTGGPVRNAAVTGTTPWTYRELVIDIAPGTNAPGDAKFLPMGVVLNGTGQVWVRDLKFEEVPRETPLTP